MAATEIDRYFVARDEVIPARGATAFTMYAGQVCRVVDVDGKQVPDFICFNRHNLDDKLSIQNTQLINGTIFITTGHHLFSTECRELMTIVADTVRIHDLISGSCSEYTNQYRYGVRGTVSCRGNFERVLKPYGLKIGEIPYSFNIFMNVPVASDGRTGIQEPESKAGDYIDLRANVDLLVAISNCPQERNPCNGWNPSPLQVIVYETEPRGKGGMNL